MSSLEYGFSNFLISIKSGKDIVLLCFIDNEINILSNYLSSHLIFTMATIMSIKNTTINTLQQLLYIKRLMGYFMT